MYGGIAGNLPPSFVKIRRFAFRVRDVMYLRPRKPRVEIIFSLAERTGGTPARRKRFHRKRLKAETETVFQSGGSRKIDQRQQHAVLLFAGDQPQTVCLFTHFP